MDWRNKACRKKVFVGLSGGVDSAVAAALLKEAGAQVSGVFIKGWYPPGMPCTWAADRRDAMRVAAKLAIPFITLDASATYKQSVMDYLLNEYRAGRTPNPDVMCNRDVKFGAFYRYALAHGADYIATGHYVSGEKDQRYFLWAVPEEALSKTLFPLDGREKRQVRALATRLSLPVATKRESQGICFLGPVSVEDFLLSELGSSPGEALDEQGRQVGAHHGAALYTIGERVPLPRGPWYIRGKDMQANTLTVMHTPPSASTGEGIRIVNANWHTTVHEVQGEVMAQYRYRGPMVRGHITDNVFVPSQRLSELPAPGQSLVFYRQDELLGGGIIA